jgi:hypothetical protein
MTKLAIIGVVIAGLGTPAAAAVSQGAKQAHPQQAKAVRACLQGPVFAPGRNATMCGPQVFPKGITVWYRDPASGTIVPIPGGKWRTEDGAEQHPQRSEQMKGGDHALPRHRCAAPVRP